MRTRFVIILASAGALCLMPARPARAGRGGGFAGGVGSVRFSGGGVYVGTYDDDQAWNAGFNGGPSPAQMVGNKQVATVNPAAESGFWNPFPSQNRVDPRLTSPVNYGSIQNAVGPSPAGPSDVSPGTGGNPAWLLVQMSEYLAGLQQLTMTIDVTSEKVAASGQKTQISSQQVTYVQRPGKLAVEISTNKARTRIVYDGSVVTAIDTIANMYGTIPVSGSLDSVLDTLARDYGMAVPADDLLYKGAYARLEGKVRFAHNLGLETIDGRSCHHAAFGGDNVDFQIWLQKGDEPIPRQVLIIYKSVPGRPRCKLEITRWETGPIPASVFKADVPANAREMTILPHPKTAR